jgi:transcriptional regulator with XRE-family HTH domain
MGSRSIREVARGAGVAHGTLVKLLNGETLPGFETLVRLSEVLNVRLLASVEEPRELDEEYLWARFRAAVVPLTLDLNLVGADRCGVLRTDFAIVIKAALDLDPISCHSALEKASEARQLSPDAVFVGVLASGEPDRSTLELLRRERAIAFWPSVASGRVFVDSRGREWNPRTRQRRIS